MGFLGRIRYSNIIKPATSFYNQSAQMNQLATGLNQLNRRFQNASDEYPATVVWIDGIANSAQSILTSAQAWIVQMPLQVCEDSSLSSSPLWPTSGNQCGDLAEPKLEWNDSRNLNTIQTIQVVLNTGSAWHNYKQRPIRVLPATSSTLADLSSGFHLDQSAVGGRYCCQLVKPSNQGIGFAYLRLVSLKSLMEQPNFRQ